MKIRSLVAEHTTKPCKNFKDALYHLRRLGAGSHLLKPCSAIGAFTDLRRHYSPAEVDRVVVEVVKFLNDYVDVAAKAQEELPDNSCDNLSTTDTMHTANTRDTFDGSYSSRVSKKVGDCGMALPSLWEPVPHGVWAPMSPSTSVEVGMFVRPTRFPFRFDQNCPLALDDGFDMTTPGQIVAVDDEGDIRVHWPVLAKLGICDAVRWTKMNKFSNLEGYQTEADETH
eukprot:TRINITY_DN32400_c1_g1_i2.p1 TRINITY_DN32400_c1_g1~~TRINITY_DN32400_c1_g1_i2.p1  ORF type:complete len:227 (+),score=33.20 TRINITY_DN32400_c1_g1_i2:243-923(+)